MKRERCCSQCVRVGTSMFTDLFVWADDNYCLCLWPLRPVSWGSRTQVQPWEPEEPEQTSKDSLSLRGLARPDTNTYLPCLLSLSLCTRKQELLVETLDLRGICALLAEPELFVTYLVFVFGFGCVETILSHSQCPSCIVFLSHVLLRFSFWSQRTWCDLKVCINLSFQSDDKSRFNTEEKLFVRTYGVFKWLLSLPDKQKSIGYYVFLHKEFLTDSHSAESYLLRWSVMINWVWK